MRLLGVNRDHVKQALAEAGIGAMIYYPIPQDQLPVYQGQYPANPVSDKLGQEVLSLPMWPELTLEQIATVESSMETELTVL